MNFSVTINKTVLGLYNRNIINYGDSAANNYLIPKILPIKRALDATHTVVGLGSILCKCLNQSATPLVICGTGYQYCSPYRLKERDSVVFVRGEYTCQMTGISVRHACGDGMLQLANVWKEPPDPQFDECIVLKHDNTNINREHVYTAFTFDFVEFTKLLLMYRRIVSDALHPAIVADLFGIPWRPLRWEAKWLDHFAMLGITSRPKDFVLSDRSTLKQVIAEQNSRLQNWR